MGGAGRVRAGVRLEHLALAQDGLCIIVVCEWDVSGSLHF